MLALASVALKTGAQKILFDLCKAFDLKEIDIDIVSSNSQSYF